MTRLPPELRAAAMGTARARRFLLLGRRGPWFARAAAGGEAEADAEEHGVAAVQAVALLGRAADIDEALASFQGRIVERSGEAPLTPAQALELMGQEDDPDEREGLARSLARALRGPLEAAGAAFASCADDAAERGGAELAPAAEVAAGHRLLEATEDAARDVLEWATQRQGRSRRTRMSWPDLVRVLRQRPLDAVLRAARDPWPTLRGWREAVGLSVELRFEAQVASGFLGSWAVRLGGGRLVAGASASPGALQWRFALQALGRADALREAGEEALLPADPAAAELLGALYPGLLADRAFLDRGARLRPTATPDDVRLLALSEVLLARLQAAIFRTLNAFETGRALEPLRDTAADAFRRALFVPVPPEIGLLFCRPWAPPLASPRASLAAAALAPGLRERFDVDWWRNPRATPELRRLASQAASAKLEDLVPGCDDPATYGRWAAERLGA
ncbi:MAG: hypothetical protein ACYDCL_14580 [Myxococcales bacterium]